MSHALAAEADVRGHVNEPIRPLAGRPCASSDQLVRRRRALTDTEMLLPAEAACRLGVPTRVVINAMYEKKSPRVRLDDGTLGVPAEALEDFNVEAGRVRRGLRAALVRASPKPHSSLM